MAFGFRFGDQLGFYDDDQIFDAAWNWSVKEYKSKGKVEPEKFIRESTDRSLQQADEIQSSIRSGAGFADAKANRDVERAAVSFVSMWYEAQDFYVESVENQKLGYDLICSNGSTVKYVEVKGVGGPLQAFIITRREIQQAQTNPDFVICIVTSALSEQRQLFCYSGSELLDDFKFDSLAYRAALK